MRRARYLAGDHAFPEADSARDWMCGPAIPTQTCAPAWQAGLSTNDCMDHQDPFIAAGRMHRVLSQSQDGLDEGASHGEYGEEAGGEAPD